METVYSREYNRIPSNPFAYWKKNGKVDWKAYQKDYNEEQKKYQKPLKFFIENYGDVSLKLEAYYRKIFDYRGETDKEFIQVILQGTEENLNKIYFAKGQESKNTLKGYWTGFGYMVEINPMSIYVRKKPQGLLYEYNQDYWLNWFQKFFK